MINNYYKKYNLKMLYQKMVLIRKFENYLSSLIKKGELSGALHLCVGQEAVSVGVAANLHKKDTVTFTHRGHGHFLAKGGKSKHLLAEIFGKNSGVCKGYGGSMHISDFEKGIIGANAIVGGGIGISTGAALAAKLKSNNSISVAFFGDVAINKGILAESLNISSIWDLPIVFICENNLYSEFSRTKDMTAGSIIDRSKPYKIKSFKVNGNDIFDVLKKSDEAIQYTRNKNGPTFIEAKTYTISGHVELEEKFLSKQYRKDREIDQYMKKDPIAYFKNILIKNNILNDLIIKQIDSKIDKHIIKDQNYVNNSSYAEIFNYNIDFV